MKNKKTLYHFVLDKSGSMHDCEENNNWLQQSLVSNYQRIN
jgi:hypothetical protein